MKLFVPLCRNTHGAVSAEDLALWTDGSNEPPQNQAATAVPEPGTIALLYIAIGFMAAKRLT